MSSRNPVTEGIDGRSCRIMTIDHLPNEALLPRFSANISTLYRELPLLERIDCARHAGFTGIEIQFPYEIDATELKAALDDAGLPLVLCNFPAGDLMQDGEGYAAIPGREAEFEEALDSAAGYAQILRPRSMNLLSGRPREAQDTAECLRRFESHLVAAHARLQPLGVKLLTEAINPYDLPRFLLSRPTQVLDLIRRLPQIELLMQLDIYHATRVGEDPLYLLDRHIDRIGHIQFADHPGRGEPGSGDIDFDSLFARIDALPYAGFVGAEYFPTAQTRTSLDWLRRYAEPQGDGETEH